MREHLLDRIAMTLSADVQWTFQVGGLGWRGAGGALEGRWSRPLGGGAWWAPGGVCCNICSARQGGGRHEAGPQLVAALHAGWALPPA